MQRSAGAGQQPAMHLLRAAGGTNMLHVGAISCPVWIKIF